ncbi:hypothetical protein, partial [Xanthomonas graminis]
VHMKRIGVLLVVLVGLTWLGSNLAPRSEPKVVAAPKAVSTPSPKQAEPAATKSKQDVAMTAAEKKAQQVKWFGAETIVAAERAVRRELKDPDAARFQGVRASYTDEFGVVACGRVNARNELGGYSGFRRFVFGDGRVILEQRDSVGAAWSKACL